jgi:hypothetical protein
MGEVPALVGDFDLEASVWCLPIWRGVLLLQAMGKLPAVLLGGQIRTLHNRGCKPSPRMEHGEGWVVRRQPMNCVVRRQIICHFTVAV